MQKRLFNIGLGLLLLNLTACDAFLKEDSQDLVIPENVEDFIPVLYGEGYPTSFEEEVDWVKLMTDDVEMGPLDRDQNSEFTSEEFDNMNGEYGEWAYRWDINIEEKIIDKIWDERYKNILGCNTIIDALPVMNCPEQDSGKYYSLAAQAHALRAYHYFCLINFYAKPWSKENLDELGVIIRRHPQIMTAALERSTIGEVYELINEDIEAASRYMTKAEISANKHVMNPTAIKLLATRVALFQENWDEVLRVGKSFMAENSFLLNLNEIPEDQMGDDGRENFTMMNLEQNKEIVFTFGSKSSYEYLSNSGMFGLGFRVSYSDKGSLYQSYTDDDLRKKAWFKQNKYDEGFPPYIPASTDYQMYYPIKYYSYSSGRAYHENWRTVEVYLNMAEAYARKEGGISHEAIDLLNTLRSNRLKNYENLTTADFNLKEDLVRFIWEERRRELCFEEAMRFWDLRRQGMPSITHKWYGNRTTYVSYILPQGSPNYVLSIPASEINGNSLITSNERDVIEPR